MEFDRGATKPNQRITQNHTRPDVASLVVVVVVWRLSFSFKYGHCDNVTRFRNASIQRSNQLGDMCAESRFKILLSRWILRGESGATETHLHFQIAAKAEPHFFALKHENLQKYETFMWWLILLNRFWIIYIFHCSRHLTKLCKSLFTTLYSGIYRSRIFAGVYKYKLPKIYHRKLNKKLNIVTGFSHLHIWLGDNYC